ncbi:hypothetical protein G7Z17_g347 [Cylindrodendrum hubeiense]|uniref:Zn(2)-C6 fungal-type domain-containing protein n=1 Tax=Cylindrodendrum hubeiense TaxID=595255 RepID=A0A9P5HLW1_9HYPO|nr:hypothetical protein G7Z17_g347 [Cylindrodendrum hubeiense]
MQACDLCYRKRIKCDGQRPRCSNCQTYSCECTHEATSRQKKKKNKKSPAPANCRRQEQQQEQRQQPETHDVRVQQQQVGPLRPVQQSIEQEQAIDASLLAENHEPLLAPPMPVAVSDQQLQVSILSSPLLSFPPAHAHAPAPTPTLTPTPTCSRQLRELELPSEEIVRHVIDVYLATFNSILPLFHPQCLYRTVDNWYRQPSDSQRRQHEPSSWAAINVALALAQCHGPGNLSPVAAQAMSVAECLENAQSVLTEVLAGDMDLQHVQILLGLGILFLGARPDDVRVAMMFVSTAMRLAQAMGMHRRDYYDNDYAYHYEGAASPEAIQRRRVFWIAYILDRDVAARTRQAPIQQDADMDLDLPPDDDAGFVHIGDHVGEDTDTDTDTGRFGFNLFRARVELAQIQGRVYDCALSVRASCIDPGESARLAQSIRLSIQQWKARLPAALSVDVLSLLSQVDTDNNNNSVPYLPAAMCYMHSLIIVCLGQLCRVNSMDFHWIEKVLSYARGIGNGIGDGKTTPSSPSSSSHAPCFSSSSSFSSSFSSFASSVPPPPQPQGWNVLVSECREFMRLFQSIRSKHPTFVNVQLCPFASGLLCLSVNSFLNFEDGNRLTDQRLMTGAAGILGQVKEQTQLGTVSKVLEVYAELDWHLMLLTTGLVT